MGKVTIKEKDKYTSRSDLPPREFDSELDSPALSNQPGNAPIARGSDLPSEELDDETPKTAAEMRKPPKAAQRKGRKA